MIELVYYSEASPNLTSEDISDILETARDFNSKNSITGCLLYHNSEFLQVLEGKKKIVLDLFTSIKKDKRHSSVTLIATDNINEKSFQIGAWHIMNSIVMNKKKNFSVIILSLFRK